jgi:hypothetical protein
MPGEQKIEEVFRIFVNKANARTGLCMDPPSKECPKPSPPLDDIYQLLKNYMHQVSREIPELVINKEVEIDVVGSTGEHFEHMFEAEGMFLWVCNTEALSWL